MINARLLVLILFTVFIVVMVKTLHLPEGAAIGGVAGFVVVYLFNWRKRPRGTEQI